MYREHAGRCPPMSEDTKEPTCTFAILRNFAFVQLFVSRCATFKGILRMIPFVVLCPWNN